MASEASLPTSVRKIFIYEDNNQGASEDCIHLSKDSLNRALSWLTSEKLLYRMYSVDTITAERLIQDATWKKECVLLVFPGGRDLPYCSLLNGRGNSEIKEFVRNGGSYLGICAGAYYGCESIEFEKDDPVMSVCGGRELSFFRGVGRGSYYPGFNYHNRSGARAAPILLKPGVDAYLDARYTDELFGHRVYSYFNGGCEFVPNDDLQATTVPDLTCSHIVATYAERSHGVCSVSSNAVVLCECGAGRVVLTGVHLEADPEALVHHGDPLPQDVLKDLHSTNRRRRLLFSLLLHFLLSNPTPT